MSCWHGWHGCGPYFGTPRDLDWWGPRDWDEEVDRPVGRRYRRPRRLDSESVLECLASLFVYTLWDNPGRGGSSGSTGARTGGRTGDYVAGVRSSGGGD